MSTDEKSDDKKEIEDEEREKMLNEENKRESADVEVERPAPASEMKGDVEKMRKALEDSEKEKEKEGKKKIPIGGIRIPGFLRSRSREKTNKDSETDPDEDRDLLHDVPPAEGSPAADRDSQGGPQDDTPPVGKRLPSLKISNPFSKKGKEAELGAAGLASMETLDDKSADQGDDGMESVKLDVEEKVDGEKADATSSKQDWRERLRKLSKYRLIIGGVALFIILLIIIIVVAASGPRPLPSAPLISGRFITSYTGCGPVEGLIEGSAYVFRGIPYAKPPLGDLRWKPAEELQLLDLCWEGTLKVHNATPFCWQMYPNGTTDGTEDCLTLDVYTPRVGYDYPLAVVVLVGADTLTGGSPGDLRPSAKLAHEYDVVYVRPNFRLGVFGFLAVEPLSKTVHPPTSGNYALSDLLAVLNWVKLNIKHFGGDPNIVTVLGHRAGATLVTALVTSRRAQGLLTHVWLSSGSARFPGNSLAESEMKNAKYIKKLDSCQGVEDIADCLKHLDAEDLIDNIPEEWKSPIPDLPKKDEPERHEWLVLDGAILQKHPFEAFENEDGKIKVVIGTTAHAEATRELRMQHSEWEGSNEDAIVSHIRASVFNRTLADEALKRYGSTWNGLASLMSDIRTVCPLLELSRRLQQPVPFYVVTQKRGDPALADIGADVAAIMGHYIPQTIEQRRYTTAMQKLFYSFVWHGELKQEEADRKKNNNRVILIEQDSNPSIEYPNCDLWLQNDIVPRYARVD